VTFHLPTGRYARHEIIDWWDQDRLRKASIVVVGAGAIGNEVLKNLALAGIGRLLIVDFDTVALSNLTRSVLFRESHINQPKAEVAARAATDINPEVEAYSLVGDLELDLGLGVMRDADLLIGCLDSLHARLALNRRASLAGVPWVNAAISDTAAEVGVFDARIAACYECGISAAAASREAVRFSCQGFRNPAEVRRMPTTSVTASLAGALAVNEAILRLHGDEQGLPPGSKTVVSLKPHAQQRATIPRNPDCPWHDPLGDALAVQAATPRAAATEVGVPGAELRLWNEFVVEVRCTSCGHGERVMRTAASCAVELLDCARCGPRMRDAERVSSIGPESALYDAPWASLGIPPNEILQLASENRSILIRTR
jgi:molybdopterin/thiamine biosynthesis adenylyltransferase